mgnify:CR=1 FL=1
MRLLFVVVVLFVASPLLQRLVPLSQEGGYHAFADDRTWQGIPNAALVLSNIPIFLAGLACLIWVLGPRATPKRLVPGLVVAGVGLMLTCIGSAYYHYAPSDQTLVWDRFPLAIVFAGVLLTAWGGCTGAQGPSRLDTVVLVIASVGSVMYWVRWGSLWPYAVLQFGGLATLLYLAVTKRLAGGRAWWGLLVLYVLAKLFELLDDQIWALTQHLVSGHALKHLMSAAAGFCLVWVVARAKTEHAHMPPLGQGA